MASTSYSWFNFVRSFRTCLCLLGIVLSIYALYVEVKKMQDKSFNAMCDINSKISCSKVFTSKYGTGFGLVEPLLGKDSIFNIPNSIYGISFYIFVFILGKFSILGKYFNRYGTRFGLVEPLLGKDSIFNIPNSIYGISFYIFVFILGFFDGKTVAWISMIACILSCIGCVYLAYILYFVLEDFCVVCVSTYVVNALLLILSVYHLVQLPSAKTHTE